MPIRSSLRNAGSGTLFTDREIIAIYEKLFKKAKTIEDKELLQRVLREARHHHAALSNTHLFLSDPANWYMWEEYGIADGGTERA